VIPIQDVFGIRAKRRALETHDNRGAAASLRRSATGGIRFIALLSIEHAVETQESGTSGALVRRSVIGPFDCLPVLG
jgi:hypothetical protein